jgi:hypothetical protein
VDPGLGVNRRLGDSLPEIHHAAYDHPATTLLVHGFLPGVPMDFLSATTRAPWGFVRNTDERYGVRVAAEERGFLDWQVDDAVYDEPASFRRCKRLGFAHRGRLRAGLAALADLEARTHYDLDEMAAGAQDLLPGATARILLLFARAFLEDCHDLCNVGRVLDRLDPATVAFDLAARAPGCGATSAARTG